jgi:elongator complex protein 2
MKPYRCRLVHHGAAAAVSGNQIVTWIPGDTSAPVPTLVYASHAILNIVETTSVLPLDSVETPPSSIVRHVHQTLRTTLLEKDDTTAAASVSPAIITCVVSPPGSPTLVSGFSNGTIQVWRRHPTTNVWTEYTVVGPSLETRSITTLAAVETRETLHIAAGHSAGWTWYQCTFPPLLPPPEEMESPNEPSTEDLPGMDLPLTQQVATYCTGAIATLHFTKVTLPYKTAHDSVEASSILFLFVGTASPRHNKVHVYHGSIPQVGPSTPPAVLFGGCLSGHEDWITSFASSRVEPPLQNTGTSSVLLLASGSQDARIRLWKFRTAVRESMGTAAPLTVSDDSNIVSEPEDDDAIDKDEDDFDELGESRLEMMHTDINLPNSSATFMTSVTLEALLCGHEESVTSVAWHPDPSSLYGVDRVLISSSTDRTILVWSESKTDDATDGIWAPLSRVGSAGGILGGSVGSTLLGFCSVSVEPRFGRTLVGHAYGGALHIWDVVEDKQRVSTPDPLPSEERAALIQWKASPCITGHFEGVTDLCWEASRGEYLLTVSNDQTCRLWAPVAVPSSSRPVWLELARPQVHGYNLSAVASLSTRRHPHVMVTGADEKEIRAFDAPKTTLRLLRAFSEMKGTGSSEEFTTIDRVERAYIPSLGLSNKASAADAAAEDDENEEDAAATTTRLPLERDLGAVSLWPEIQKLFGHNTEIYCLAASTANDSVIVASSAKARDANDAQLRLWNVLTGQCIQVLLGGHRSTVATLSFSPNGSFLASSGKDRRLCLWRQNPDNASFSLAWARDTAHKRIVWSVHFCPFAATIFASGSRDGCVKIWSIQEDGVDMSCDETFFVTEVLSFTPNFQRHGKADAVTALAFAPIPWSNSEEPKHPDISSTNNSSDQIAVLAIGLESGRIELWCIPLDRTHAIPVTPYAMPSTIDASLCHCAAVTKLTWRPIPTEDARGTTTCQSLYLASSSMDHGCRIFEIDVP